MNDKEKEELIDKADRTYISGNVITDLDGEY